MTYAVVSTLLERQFCRLFTDRGEAESWAVSHLKRVRPDVAAEIGDKPPGEFIDGCNYYLPSCDWLLVLECEDGTKQGKKQRELIS